MVDLFEVNNLCKFYEDQYGMIFDITYSSVYEVMKGRIRYKNTVKKFAICCVCVSDKAILQQLHGIIYDVLVQSERSVSYD